MNRNRVAEIEMIALNEIRYRGQVAGWKSLQDSYKVYGLTEKEAKLMAHFVQTATVTLPDVPVSFLYDD